MPDPSASSGTSPPSGTVTFLFTDIEESTRLWENHPAAMQRAHKIQEEILRTTFARHHGFAYKMIGDAFQVAFANARDALDAAIEAQRSLRGQTWDEIGDLRVRMALHAGVTEERGDDYVGPTLNRASRLTSAGYGGQVLLSQTAFDLVRDHISSDVSLRDLGARKLKDLVRREHIYQLIAPNLPTEFPPLKTLDSFPNNLPLQLTTFIGREHEMQQVKQLLATTRLLTLTGAGGCGKTRLALQVAADSFDDPAADTEPVFPDGIWLIELAPLTDPALIAPTIASALKIPLPEGRAIQIAVSDFLHDKMCLLVFDNCEHLIDACAHLSETLLRSAPRFKILATSRETMDIAGEVRYRVPSLAAPNTREVPPPEQLNQYEAVKLFVERARLVKPEFAVTEANAAAVAQICARLQGIPLAIELAAARVKILSVQQIAERLDDAISILVSPNRIALPRQRTLRATMDWSYDLTLESERVLFRRVSAFAGGCTLDAAEFVCAGDVAAEKQSDALASDVIAPNVLDLLSRLVDKSLVIPEEEHNVLRYQMLVTVRQYAREKLVESGEFDRIAARHRDWFLGLAEAVDADARTKKPSFEWMARLSAEVDNFRAALEWSEKGSGGIEKGLRLCAALGRFWEKRGLDEGREWLGKFLPRADPRLHAAYPKALSLAGQLARLQGDHDAAIEFYEKRLELSERQGDTLGLAETHRELGLIFYRRGDYSAAIDHLQRAIKIGETINDQNLVALAHMRLGLIHYEYGDMASALASHERSLTYFQQTNQPIYVAASIGNLARVYHQRNEYDQAIQNYLQVIQMYQTLGENYSLCLAYINLSEVYLDQADYAQALSYLDVCVKIAEEFGYDLLRAMALGDLAASELGRNEPRRALEFVSRALDLVKNVQAKAQEGNIHRVRGEILAALGKGADAKLDFEAASRLLEPINRKPELARLYKSYGTFLVGNHKTRGEGEDYLRRAEELFELLGSRREVENTKIVLQKVNRGTE